MSKILPVRRRLLQASLAIPATGLSGVLAHAAAPAVIGSDRERPGFPSGVQSGDVLSDRGVVWARSDRAARMWVEWSTTASFVDAQRVRGPFALEATDYTARVDLTRLPAGQDIFYRVQWEDLAGGPTSEMVSGRFRTAPEERARRDVRFLWSGDTCGQGWGINEDIGGMTIYEQMRKLNPDFFIHSGDNIYADGPMQPQVQLPDGQVWRNTVLTDEKRKVAETLTEFRGNYRYNQLDANVRRFQSEVMQIWQWDDHEIMNNWSPSKDVSADARYTEKSVPLMVARGQRAFLENAPMRWHAQDESDRVYRKIPWGPLLDVFVIDMRSYRGPNGENLEPRIDEHSVYLGAAQIAWLKQALKQSRAVWKVIAADMPIGLVVGDGKNAAGHDIFEAVANGDNGAPRGRELEIAELLSFMRRENIHNTVWLTADVHYTAAHHYDPSRAHFTDFGPFWEFVSGPLWAGTFGPNTLDMTFGPQVRFVKAPPTGQANLAPSAGYQFFGDVQIDGRTAEMTVHLRDMTGASLWNTRLAPRRA
jgi:alkaline phosphatase D